MVDDTTNDAEAVTETAWAAAESPSPIVVFDRPSAEPATVVETASDRWVTVSDTRSYAGPMTDISFSNSLLAQRPATDPSQPQFELQCH